MSDTCTIEFCNLLQRTEHSFYEKDNFLGILETHIILVNKKIFFKYVLYFLFEKVKFKNVGPTIF